MVYEHVHLMIRTGSETHFEAAFAAGKGLIESAPGCSSVELFPSVDQQGVYLLRVGWNELRDHTQIYQQSPENAELSATLGAFIEDVLTSVHFAADRV